MREYLQLCLEGPASILTRQIILEKNRQDLLQEAKRIQDSIDYIAWKQNFYQEVLEGKREYISNLLPEE
jgi:hypothetical protein